MKKKLMVLALTLLVALSISLVACVEPGTGKPLGDNGKFDDLKTTESVYGFSAASAGILISSMGNGSNTAATAAEDEVTDTLDTAQLDNYMALVESLLSDGGFNVLAQTSDREEYTEKMVISYKDMQGATHEYVMYYNQILEKTETDEEDGEVEENYSIEGVMVIDEVDYAIRGERKNETEEGESETETEFVVTLGENKYMRVEQSFETEEDEIEQEYSYSLYENNQLIERSSFSFETEQNETELKMSTLKDGITQVIYFEKEVENGEEVIKIHVGDGKNGKGYIVRIAKDENGATRYEYSPTEYDD